MLTTVSQAIDALNKKQGEISSLLILPMLGVVVYEVFMRYAFNAPTIWGFELTIFLYGIHFILGYAYTDSQDGHVRVDVLTMRMGEKSKAKLNVITLLVIFFPFMICLTFWSWKFALISVVAKELNSTSWSPPIYPIKVLMAIGFTLLLFQGGSHLIKNIRIASGNTTR
jgi:TRAP-type mannitol/chloroaromatic compound transport system permease small subunit